MNYNILFIWLYFARYPYQIHEQYNKQALAEWNVNRHVQEPRQGVIAEQHQYKGVDYREDDEDQDEMRVVVFHSFKKIF